MTIARGCNVRVGRRNNRIELFIGLNGLTPKYELKLKWDFQKNYASLAFISDADRHQTSINF